MFDQSVIRKLKTGGVGVLPTDTIFGLSCSVHDSPAVARIFALKKRQQDKPFVVLVSSESQFSQLGINLDVTALGLAKNLWEEAPTSIILRTGSLALDHVHGGAMTLAVRLPVSRPALVELIDKTGPLISTSVNISGSPALLGLDGIRQHFPDLDFYVEGDVGDAPSRLVRFEEDGAVTVISR